jgi:hypothetical protein
MSCQTLTVFTHALNSESTRIDNLYVQSQAPLPIEVTNSPPMPCDRLSNSFSQRKNLEDAGSGPAVQAGDTSFNNETSRLSNVVEAREVSAQRWWAQGKSAYLCGLGWAGDAIAHADAIS